MIENPEDQNQEPLPSLEFVATAPNVSSTKVDFGTKTKYVVTFVTDDPQVLTLAALKPDGKLTVRVTPKYGAKRANEKTEFK